MELRITRPAVLADGEGVRAFAPNLTVEVDEPTAEQILAQHAGIAVAPQSAGAATPYRRKSTDSSE